MRWVLSETICQPQALFKSKALSAFSLWLLILFWRSARMEKTSLPSNFTSWKFGFFIKYMFSALCSYSLHIYIKKSTQNVKETKPVKLHFYSAKNLCFRNYFGSSVVLIWMFPRGCYVKRTELLWVSLIPLTQMLIFSWAKHSLFLFPLNSREDAEKKTSHEMDTTLSITHSSRFPVSEFFLIGPRHS